MAFKKNHYINYLEYNSHHMLFGTPLDFTIIFHYKNSLNNFFLHYWLKSAILVLIYFLSHVYPLMSTWYIWGKWWNSYPYPESRVNVHHSPLPLLRMTILQSFHTLTWFGIFWKPLYLYSVDTCFEMLCLPLSCWYI